MQLFGSKLKRTIFSVLVNFQDKNSEGDLLGSESCITEKKNGQIPQYRQKYTQYKQHGNSNLEFVNIQTFWTQNFTDMTFQLQISDSKSQETRPKRRGFISDFFYLRVKGETNPEQFRLV